MRTRTRGQDGSTLVEFAMILPFLAIMTFGVLEFGLVLQDRMKVQAATRAGLRVGSAAGRTVTADQTLLLSLGSAANDIGVGNVDWVLVFKSSATDGSVPATCTNPPRSVASTCNLYTGEQLGQLLAGTAPAAWFGCGASALDRFWCPTARQTIQANGTDHLGIWIQARHSMLTGFFGSTVTITDRGVMRLEPQGA